MRTPRQVRAGELPGDLAGVVGEGPGERRELAAGQHTDRPRRAPQTQVPEWAGIGADDDQRGARGVRPEDVVPAGPADVPPVRRDPRQLAGAGRELPDLQVAPSIWTAYRTERPTGLSAGTWLLILGELSCWLTFGLYKSDPRLITLGLTGVTASVLMLARIRRAGRQERASLNRLPGDQRRLAAGQQPAGDGGDQRQSDQQDQHVTQRHVAEHRGQAGVCPR